MTQTSSRSTDHPTPGTTPAARAHRRGQPTLARPLLIVAVVVLAAVAGAVFYSTTATDIGESPEAGGVTTAAPPTGAGTNPDGTIDTATGEGGGMGSDTLNADDATAAGEPAE